MRLYDAVSTKFITTLGSASCADLGNCRFRIRNAKEVRANRAHATTKIALVFVELDFLQWEVPVRGISAYWTNVLNADKKVFAAGVPWNEDYDGV